MRANFSPAIALMAIVTWLGGCTAVPDCGCEPLSYDGLVPLEDTLMTRVWVREGFSLAGYSKVILEDAGIRYRPVPADPARQAAANAFPLTEAQKQNLKRLIYEEFDKALDRLRLEEVSTPGPDVLRVRGFMLDVVSHRPPGGGYRLDSVGQATFVVELVDSLSNAVLVRALDTRAARMPGQKPQADQAAREAQVRHLLSRWANMLVDALNDLTAIDELKGA